MLRTLRVVVRERRDGLQAGIAVERAGAFTERIVFGQPTVPKKVSEREAVGRRKADVLPSVPSAHRGVALDPSGEEFVRPVVTVRRENEEREIVGVDVLDVVESVREGAFGGPRDSDFARQRSEDLGVVRRVPRFGPKHVAHLMRNETVEETGFDGTDGHEQRVRGILRLRGSHDRHRDDLRGHGPNDAKAVLRIFRGDFLESTLHLASPTPTRTIHDRCEHGRATRGIRKNLCGSSDMCPKFSDHERFGRGHFPGARDVSDKSPKRTRAASITPAARFGQIPETYPTAAAVTSCSIRVLDKKSTSSPSRFGRTKTTD